MPEKILDRSSGNLIFNDFKISKESKSIDLKNHFGDHAFKKSNFNTNCFVLSQQKIGAYYFRFYFFFGDKFLEKIEFEVETEPIERIPWSSNRDVETQWIASQMDDESHFVWDMNQAGRHYHLAYDWGSIGAYYDFKNGTFTSKLIYK